MRKKNRALESQRLLDDESFTPTNDSLFAISDEYRRKQYCFNKLTFKPFVSLVVCSSVVLTLIVCAAVVLPVVILVLGGDMAQTAIDGTTISFTHTQLSEPNAHSVMVSTTVHLTNPSKYDATIKATTLDILYKGAKFGTIEMPETKIKAHKPLSFKMSEELTVTDAKTFKKCAFHLLEGETIEWTLDGRIDLEVDFGIDVTFNPKLHTNVQVAGGKYALEGLDVRVMQGLSNELHISLTQHITNPSDLSLRDLGDLVFNIYSVDQVLMGTITVFDFTVDEGVTIIPNTTGKTAAVFSPSTS